MRTYDARPRRRLESFVKSAFLLLFTIKELIICDGLTFSIGCRSRNHNVAAMRRCSLSKSISLLPSSRRNDDWYGDDPRPNAVDVPDVAPDQSGGRGSEKKSSEPSMLAALSAYFNSALRRRPPPQVEDYDVLYYDIFLILNLTVSISFWVVHRMDFAYIGTAFNEGCLMCLLWIGSGLSTGAFLNSAVDGHFGSASDRGGPKAAAMLAFHTFLNAINLRLLFALVVAVLQHRQVGIAAGEQLMPLELGFGLALMIFWRTLHSSMVPRM